MHSQKKRFDKMLELLAPAVREQMILAYLFFDDQTVCPPKGRTILTDTKAFQEARAHEAFITDEIGASISYLVRHNSGLTIPQRRIVNHMGYCYKVASALPPEFVERQGATVSKANQAWAKARTENDWGIFLPHFEEVLKLTREMAVLLGADKDDGNSQFETLLKLYEPGMKLERISAIVEQVKTWVIDYLKRIQASDVKLTDNLLHGHFDEQSQRLLAEAGSRCIGYDYQRGHLSMTTHPFMAGLNPDDVRITMRILPEFLPACFFAVLHEAGHALYGQNVDPLIHKIDTEGTLYSLGLHEASSRMWENMVGRGRPFLEHMYPTIRALFPQFHDVPLDEFYAAVNRVEPSYIRVEADELTYMLHIVLRFELEQAIMRGEVELKDVPSEWNRRFKEYFGIEVDKDANGCLQDVHWSYGAMGYFVTYLLGNLAGAQQWDKFRDLNLGWATQFRAGNLASLLEYMKKRHYRWGYVMSLDELMIDATSHELDPDYWFTYIEDKMGPLYQLAS